VTSTTARAEQIAAFYARHADRLHRNVALLARAELDVDRAAQALRLPPDELRAARAEHEPAEVFSAV
jgi:hypothetical protein